MKSLNYAFVFVTSVVTVAGIRVKACVSFRLNSNFTFKGIAREDELINLKGKLKVAVERIKELSKERSKLINVGNRMKAELATMKSTIVLYLNSQKLTSEFTQIRI